MIVKGTYFQNSEQNPLVYGDVEIHNVPRRRLRGDYSLKSFCNAVVNGIAEYLLQYEIESIRLETVCHNNGVEHVGLVILLQGDYVSPTIYLEQYYQYMVRQQASLSDGSIMIKIIK